MSAVICDGSGLIVNADSRQRARCPWCGKRYRVGNTGKLRRHEAQS